MRRNINIAVAGKGGVGKTTTTALILKYLTSKVPLPNVLVMDVDPDTNIPDVLGLEITRDNTVGGIAQELKKKINEGNLQPNFDKAAFLESKTIEIMVEEDDFDLVVMSKSEGEGCYCFINSTVTGILDTIQDGYDYVLIDTSAGLEHFSRRTMRNLDYLFIITDPSGMGLKTTQRIIEITRELSLEVDKIFIIGNRFTPENEDILREKLKNAPDNVKVLGILPSSDEIQRKNLLGDSLLDLSENNETYQALMGFLKTINL